MLPAFDLDPVPRSSAAIGQAQDRPSSVSTITQSRATRVASARRDRGVTDLTDPLRAACEASNVSAGSVDGGLKITRVGDGQ